jgi:PAS domain S-box-containing protein
MNQIVLYHLYSNRLTTKAKKVGDPLYLGKNCMAVRNGNPLLASILAKSLKHAQNEGVLNGIIRKWLGSELSHEQRWLNRVIPYLLAVSLAGVAVTVLIAVWNFQLRRKVDQKTRELTDGKLELSLTNRRLEESEARLRGITESAQDAILMVDSQGNVSFWNPAAEKILGYSGKEILGKNLHERLAPSRYLDTHRLAFAEFIQTGKGKAIGRTIELEAVRKDGEEIPISLSLSSVLLEEGWHAVGIIRDITEMKLATQAIEEEAIRRRLIFEQSRDGIVAITTSGKVFEANQRFAEMLGYTPAEVVSLYVWNWDANLQQSDIERMS